MSHLLDIGFVLAFLIVSAWMMSGPTRLFRAFVLSSLLCWGILLAGEACIGSVDPTHDNIGGAAMVLFFGWAPGVVYCGIWTAVLSLGRWLDGRARSVHSEE